jgi:diguanylate cyclase (GGDEF)-like protein/PAS domain S-box-containing protein
MPEEPRIAILKPNKSFLFFPAIKLMSKLSFAKKFIFLGLIALVSAGITLYGLYNNLNQAVISSQQELDGLKLIYPIIKSAQQLQRHRGLSSGVLSGIDNLKMLRSSSEVDVDQAFLILDTSFPSQSKQHEAWLKISAEWKRIKANGLQWPRDQNFDTHSRLINKILSFESDIADDFGLTTDSNLDSFYLVIAANNELLKSLERLGQIRAYGTGILGSKQATESQLINISNLLTLLNHSLDPLKANLNKASGYNPSLRQTFGEIYAHIEGASEQVISIVDREILKKKFSMQSDEYFSITTKAINEGYEQLYQTLLPTAERLIRARIQQDIATLQVNFGFAVLLMLLVAYFMVAIYFATLGNISILTKAVLSFAHGEMKDRIHLDTQDELAQIGDGFNTMADELTSLMAERKSALDLLTKIAHSVPGMVYQYRQRKDGSYCFPFASDGIREIYRVSPESVSEDASTVFDAIHPADLDNLVASIQTSAEDLSVWHHDYRVKFNDGSLKWLQGKAMPEREADGSTLWHGFITDITAYKKAELRLHMLSTAIEESPTSVVIANLDAQIEYVNPRFSEVTGYSSAEAIGKNPRILNSGKTENSVFVDLWDKLNQGQTWTGEFINKKKNGEVYYEEAHISPIKGGDGLTSHFVAVKLDVTKRKEMEEQVRQLAFYDTLTNLPNRRLLNDRLTQTLVASKRNGFYGALMFLDLDNFKPLNDTHGHVVGDLLLIEAARRIKNCVRESDTVARFGGDEFVVMLNELNADKTAATTQAQLIAKKILAHLSDPYLLTISTEGPLASTVEHRCTASIGVAMFINQDANQDDVLKWADAAMYQAKESGRNLIRFYGGS